MTEEKSEKKAAKSEVINDPLEMMREPFPDHQISKLPKESRKQINERKDGKNVEWNCSICGGIHHKDAVHLDYVGHAALTARLLDADINWSWEPMAFTAEGLPVFDGFNGLWIKLTVGKKTRLGYGSADGKTGGNAIKEIIGDALRNASMRFGAALDLWHKGGDLYDGGGDDETTEKKKTSDNQQSDKPAYITLEQQQTLSKLAEDNGVSIQQICETGNISSLEEILDRDLGRVVGWIKEQKGSN